MLAHLLMKTLLKSSCYKQGQDMVERWLVIKPIASVNRSQACVEPANELRESVLRPAEPADTDPVPDPGIILPYTICHSRPSELLQVQSIMHPFVSPPSLTHIAQ